MPWFQTARQSLKARYHQPTRYHQHLKARYHQPTRYHQLLKARYHQPLKAKYHQPTRYHQLLKARYHHPLKARYHQPLKGQISPTLKSQMSPTLKSQISPTNQISPTCVNILFVLRSKHSCIPTIKSLNPFSSRRTYPKNCSCKFIPELSTNRISSS